MNHGIDVTVIDFADCYLPGTPMAVSLILSDATWDRLTRHPRSFLRKALHDTALPDMKLRVQIEQWVADLIEGECAHRKIDHRSIEDDLFAPAPF